MEAEHDYGREELPETARDEDLLTVTGRLRAALLRAGREPTSGDLLKLLAKHKLVLNRQTPHNWFRDAAKQIDSRYLFQVADALNVSARWLATGTPPVAPMPREVVPGAARLLNVYQRLDNEYRTAFLSAVLGLAAGLKAEHEKDGDPDETDEPKKLAK